MEVPGWKAKKTTKETVQRPSPPPPTEAALRATVQQGKAKDEAKELKPHLECPSSPMTVAITMTVPWGGGGGDNGCAVTGALVLGIPGLHDGAKTDRLAKNGRPVYEAREAPRD